MIVATPDAYHFGSWHWRCNSRVHFDGRIEAPDPVDPVFRAASRAPSVRHFLTWARFPYLEIEAEANEHGYLVRFDDARYDGLPGLAGGRGPVLQLDHRLESLSP